MLGMKFLPPAFSHLVNDKEIDQRRIAGGSCFIPLSLSQVFLKKDLTNIF
jgi:hypothetical protein